MPSVALPSVAMGTVLWYAVFGLPVQYGWQIVTTKQERFESTALIVHPVWRIDLSSRGIKRDSTDNLIGSLARRAYEGLVR